MLPITCQVYKMYLMKVSNTKNLALMLYKLSMLVQFRFRYVSSTWHLMWVYILCIS